MKTFEEEIESILKEVSDILISKRKDYGVANILSSPVDPQTAITVRLHDKLARITHLNKNGLQPSNEALQDTAVDIIGYGVLLKMLMDGTFESPLGEI